jgi:predicted MFS family arabinose efflux permease
VLFGINAMNFYDRGILAAVTEPVRKEWGLSDTALGGLGTLFIVLYAFVGIPLGRVADRGSRTRLLAGATALWSVMTSLSGVARSYGALALARLGVGVGEAGCAPAANSLIGDLFPPEKRARAISLFMIGLPVGTLTNFALSSSIAQAYGWRAAFFVGAIPGLVFAVLALFITDPPRGGADGHQGPSHAAITRPFRLILGIPTMWWLILSGALHNFNMYTLNSFVPAYLMRYHGTSLRTAGWYTALAIGAAGIPGLLAGGWLADRWSRRLPAGRLIVGSVALVAASPLLYFAFASAPGAAAGFALLLGSSVMLVFFYYATVYAAIQDVVEPEIRGTAMAIYFFAMYLLGGALGPLVTGGLSDHFASQAALAAGVTATTKETLEPFRAIGLRNALLVTPVIFLALGGILFAASRTVGADMARLKARTRPAPPPGATIAA